MKETRLKDLLSMAEAQKASLVNDTLPADCLLDHILALVHGNIALAGCPNSWTDDQRHDLGVIVRLLMAPCPINTNSLRR